MRLLTVETCEKLLANGALGQKMQEAGLSEPDFVPIVRLFTSDAASTWLFTEIDLDPDDQDIAFGLCDMGMRFPEFGCVSLSELATVRGRLGPPVERDLHFHASKPLSAYTDEARRCGSIVT